MVFRLDGRLSRSNGTASNGIVWVGSKRLYTLHAVQPSFAVSHKAGDVSSLLYGSNLTSGRDQLSDRQ